jgi:hypothetical protein
VRIVLMHAPSGLLDIGGPAFTVALCGHTLGDLPPLVMPHGALTRRYRPAASSSATAAA